MSSHHEAFNAAARRVKRWPMGDLRGSVTEQEYRTLIRHGLPAWALEADARECDQAVRQHINDWPESWLRRAIGRAGVARRLAQELQGD